MLSIKLCDLAKKINAELYGDGCIVIHGISSISNAKEGQITFFTNHRYKNKLISCKASAVILSKKSLEILSDQNNIAKLVVKDVYVAYAYLAQFISSLKKDTKGVIDAGAFISPYANFGKNVSIGKYSIIETGVLLEDNVVISSGCFIGKNSKIKSGTKCSENVTIHHETIIGEKCFIQSGTIIGGDGFGYAKDRGKWIKIPHFGRVIIGDRVEIGSCTTIDRGSLDDTYICDGVIIDNQCQIAHNVYIGKNTAIAGGTVIAGSITIGENCMIGGASVINGHISICNNTIITGMSMIIRSIKKPGIYSSGIPVQHNKIWRKNAVLMMNINKIYRKVKSLESISKSIIYEKN